MAEKVYFIDGLKEIGKEVGGFCANNKAHICTGLSVAGTIATGVFSARSGARSARKIDRKETELERKLTTGEKIRLCGKDFIVPVICGVTASAGAIGSDILNTQTIARTNAALIMSEKAYEKLSEKTKEVLGEKKAKQVQDEIGKEKIEETRRAGVLSVNSFRDAPRSGNGDLFAYVDEYSNLPFWSNPDYLSCCIKDLEEMMRDLKPRGDELDYYDKCVGVPYSEWLRMIGYDQKIWDCPERKHHGWNKGFADDGSDDDPIGYSTHPIEWEPGFAVSQFRWEKDPSDMRLGRLMKSNGM